MKSQFKTSDGEIIEYEVTHTEGEAEEVNEIEEPTQAKKMNKRKIKKEFADIANKEIKTVSEEKGKKVVTEFNPI